MENNKNYTDVIESELKRALEIFGTKYRIAKVLNLHTSSVYYWFQSNSIRPEYAYQLEKITRHLEKGLRKHYLCPSIYPPEDYE